MKVKPRRLPKNALLQPYTQDPACFTDCYAVELSAQISLENYITAFYTTPLFKIERFILKIAVNAPSSDHDARNLASAKTTKFAAWNVEGRDETQLLLCEFSKRTRSWLHIESTQTGTRLYFGSAVTPDPKTNRLGPLFTALLPFHKIYSRALLASARRNVKN